MPTPEASSLSQDVGRVGPGLAGGGCDWDPEPRCLALQRRVRLGSPVTGKPGQSWAFISFAGPLSVISQNPWGWGGRNRHLAAPIGRVTPGTHVTQSLPLGDSSHLLGCCMHLLEPQLSGAEPSALRLPSAPCVCPGAQGPRRRCPARSPQVPGVATPAPCEGWGGGNAGADAMASRKVCLVQVARVPNTDLSPLGRASSQVSEGKTNNRES